jgi:hypothetical protein
LFRQLAQGFRAADLRQHLAALSERDPASISHGAITYQLRRLRLHGLIERVSSSFRYQVTDFGFRVALFFTRTYNRILRPGLAAALPALRAVKTPLQRAFNVLTMQIDTTIKQTQLTPQNLIHSRQVAFVKQHWRCDKRQLFERSPIHHVGRYHEGCHKVLGPRPH